MTQTPDSARTERKVLYQILLYLSSIFFVKVFIKVVIFKIILDFFVKWRYNTSQSGCSSAW